MSDEKKWEQQEVPNEYYKWNRDEVAEQAKVNEQLNVGKLIIEYCTSQNITPEDLINAHRFFHR